MFLSGTVNNRHAFQKETGSPGTQRGLPSPTACPLYGWMLLLPFLPVTSLQHQNRSPYTGIGFFPCLGLF